MKLESIRNAFTAGFHKVKFKASTHSPEILVVSGVVGVVVGAVCACRATIKAKDVLEDAKKEREIIEDTHAKALANYSEEDYRKDIFIHNIQTAVKLAKPYIPALLIEGASIAAILGGHGILKKRNAAIAAAYSSLRSAYDEYKKRVTDEFGEDAEERLRKGLKAVEIDHPFTDEEGREMTRKEKRVVQDKKPVGEYARLFDEVNSREWSSSPAYNLSFLKNMQAQLNRKLQARGVGGVMFLNEVLIALGFEPCYEGQEVGWVYDPGNPKAHNYIDLGLYRDDRQVEAFMLGEEKSIWLDPNVDGLVRCMLPSNRQLQKA